MAASLSSHSAVGLPSRKPGCHWATVALIVGGERARRRELAGQQAHAERAAVDAGEVELLAQRQHLGVGVVEDAESLLDDSAPGQRRERPHGVGAIGAPAVRADQSLGDELFEHVTRLQGAFDGQTPHVQLDRRRCSPSRVAAGWPRRPCGAGWRRRCRPRRRRRTTTDRPSFVDVVAELGGDDDLVAPPPERLRRGVARCARRRSWRRCRRT